MCQFQISDVSFSQGVTHKRLDCSKSFHSPLESHRMLILYIWESRRMLICYIWERTAYLYWFSIGFILLTHTYFWLVNTLALEVSSPLTYTHTQMEDMLEELGVLFGCVLSQSVFTFCTCLLGHSLSSLGFLNNFSLMSPNSFPFFSPLLQMLLFTAWRTAHHLNVLLEQADIYISFFWLPWMWEKKHFYSR